MRRRTRCVGLIVAVSVMLGVATPSRAQSRFELVADDVVVFFGGTNMVHLQRAGHLETMLAGAFSKAAPKFRDLSWEADTVFRQGTVIERWRQNGYRGIDGFGDLNGQLKRLRTTVVIAQFGQLEAMDGPARLNGFVKSYKRLIDEFERHARSVVLVTPTAFERSSNPLIPDLSKRNDDLALYVRAIKKIAAERKLIVVDLFKPARRGLTENGMHIKPAAQATLAQEIMRQLRPNLPDLTKLKTLRLAVIEKHRLWYDYWRPANGKLLYGDDSKRQFTRGGKDYIPLREEWKNLLPLIEKAEHRVWRIARGEDDSGLNRPKPQVLHAAPDADIKAELASFITSDDLQVNLFASEREGLTSPLAIRWDPAGRMYVTVTTTYPHVFPGDVPNDKIIVLEDTDGDGQADKSNVFADGLNIPTGLEWGDGGVYVGQNTELLFLQDTDGDGRADRRRVVLGGFGNGDSHQTINSFIWSPGGELYFGHGDGCESRVETPWGSSDLFNAGFYRFRPHRLHLIPFLEGHMGPGNPWGIAFDEWGQVFSVDGAGGVTWLSPGRISTTHVRRLRRIGDPGGYCGIGYLDGPNLPESLHGDFVVGDYKANRVKRFSVEGQGAGYSLTWREPILRSRHRNFRPVDVKVGPDGAIYVVDWYNPITCHQDDAYRDPTRDKAHGRIWRLSSKTTAAKRPNMLRASTGDLLDALKSPSHWTRYQAKRALTQRDSAAVSDALKVWVRSLDPTLPRYEHHLFEALGAYATIEVVEPRLLDRLLRAQDHRARAFATRIVGRWHDRLTSPLELLASRVVDEHPLVRMEAVIACSEIPSVRSIEVAARVIDQPTDEWIDYAFKQTVHRLKKWWMPAFKQGDVSFERPTHLAAVLNETGGRDVLDTLKELVESDELVAQTRSAAIAAILAVGGSQELYQYGLDVMRFTRSSRYDAAAHAAALAQLIAISEFRDVRPKGDLATVLNRAITQSNPELQANALILAGIWNVKETRGSVLATARNESLATPVRAAAFAAIVDMKLPESRKLLSVFSAKPNRLDLRSVAIQSLVAVDLPAAASLAGKLFSESDLLDVSGDRHSQTTTHNSASHTKEGLDPTDILSAFLNRAGGAHGLAVALQNRKLRPASAKQLLRSLYSTGSSEQSLLDVLHLAIGSAAKSPKYSKSYVTGLVADAEKHGIANRGATIFKSMACRSCHKIGGVGGRIGPDLTAIGTTLSAERIVEELLWPNRQVKEGYSVVQVITDEGRIHRGYERKTKNGKSSDILIIQDIATQKLIRIKKRHIEEKRVTGSPMPTGLTALLSRQQLLDLVRYLSDLGKLQ